MEDNEVDTQRIVTISDLGEFYRKFKNETDERNYVDAIPYDRRIQREVTAVQNVVGQAKEVKLNVEWITKIKRLSENYKEDFPELVKNFKTWKSVRENVITRLRSTSDNLQTTSMIVSIFRMCSSAVDIAGTLFKVGYESNSVWANLAIRHASDCGFVSLLLEAIISQVQHMKMKKKLIEDEKSFIKFAEWFQQDEDLCQTFKKFIPYGIDKDIVKNIERNAQGEEGNKIFMAILATNAKENINLFKDKTFLGIAYHIATSEAGKLWYQKIILEQDTYYIDCLNCKLSEQILNDLNKNSTTETPEISVDGSTLILRHMSIPLTVKLGLSLKTLITTGYKIGCRDKPEQSTKLNEFAKKMETHLDKVTSVIHIIKPPELELDLV